MLTIDKLLQAAGNGNGDRLRQLIEGGIDINATNELDYSPLMSAARSYRVEIVTWLTERGADVNAVTSDGQYVLHAAIGETPSQPERQAACVDLLLQAGARLTRQRCRTSLPPLAVAAVFDRHGE